MASVFSRQLKTGVRWYAQLWDRGAKRGVTRTLPRSVSGKREATRIAIQMQDDLDRESVGLPTESERAWSAVADDVADEIRSAGWRDECSRFGERFGRVVGEVSPRAVTSQKCREFIQAESAAGYGDSTIRKAITFLSRVFDRCVELGLCPTNPWRAVKKPPEPRHKPNWLTHEQFRDLMAVSPFDRRFRYRFLVFTGLRRGEAWKMRWADVDWDHSQIRVQTARKGAERPHRTVPVPDDLMAELRERRGQPNVVIFPARNNWLRDFKQDCRRAGLGTKWRIHDLRHTFASWLVQAGISIYKVSALLGHKSVTSTEIYAHLAPVPERDAADVLGAVLAEPDAGAKILDVGA